MNLRLGKIDASIADYDAALKLQPKSASSLYGRGIARQRKGLVSEGASDIAAAVAINPRIVEQAKRYEPVPSAATPAA